MFSAILHASDYRNVRFSPAVIISRLIISRHTATLLNYRMTVPVRSDFLVYLNFPEVYHVRGITTPHFSGGEGTVTGQGINTTYRRNRRLNSGISCVPVPLRAGGVHGDPELAFFGSQQKKRELCIGLTYPYAPHLHSPDIRISSPSAYAASIHMLSICLY